MTRYTY